MSVYTVVEQCVRVDFTNIQAVKGILEHVSKLYWPVWSSNCQQKKTEFHPTFRVSEAAQWQLWPNSVSFDEALTLFMNFRITHSLCVTDTFWIKCPSYSTWCTAKTQIHSRCISHSCEQRVVSWSQWDDFNIGELWRSMKEKKTWLSQQERGVKGLKWTLSRH